MRALRAWLLRIASLFQRERHYREFAEEINSHLQLHIEDNVRAGMSPEEARRNVLIKLGGMDSVQEHYAERRGIPELETLVRDVRYGMRMLGKSWGLTIILAGTLALGIGVNTAIFGVLDGWLLRPLPVPAPEQIVVLASQQKEGPKGKFSYLDLLDFRGQAGTFSGLLAYGLNISGLSVNGEASEFASSTVAGNYFSALGVKPARGRLFLPGEGERPGEPLHVVLGYAYWQRRFSWDAGVVGKQVLIDGRPATILGVAQKEFHGTFFAFDMDGYLPLSMMPPGSSGFWTDRRDRELTVMGRLNADIGIRQAQSSIDVIAGRLAAAYPSADQGVTVRVIPERMARPAPFVASFVPVIASLFLALAALVLMLAALNVANILLARTIARRHEMAIRGALGAGRSRLIRQMLTESLLLAFLGAIAGVILGEWAIGMSGSLP